MWGFRSCSVIYWLCDLDNSLNSPCFISSSENWSNNYNKLTELLRERKEQINEGMMKRKVKINMLEDTECLYNINFSILTY